MNAPRIGPGTRSEIGWINDLVCGASGRLAGSSKPNLFTTLAKHRGLFRSWLWFASTLLLRGSLRSRETELVILRVAHLEGCEYEFLHHVRLAERRGIEPSEIERVQIGPDAEGWSERESILLRAATLLHARTKLDDATWNALRMHFTEEQCLELVLLVGHYQMLAMAIGTFGIRVDTYDSTRAG